LLRGSLIKTIKGGIIIIASASNHTTCTNYTIGITIISIEVKREVL